MGFGVIILPAVVFQETTILNSSFARQRQAADATKAAKALDEALPAAFSVLRLILKNMTLSLGTFD